MKECSNIASLEELNQKVKQLPFLPSVLAELMMIDKKDDYYYEKILHLAKTDPPLTALILRIANSAASAPTRQITTIEMSLARIGTQAVVRALATMGVARVFIPLNDGHKTLWWHSIETGVVARVIANIFPHLKVKPDFAYTCGLLHDIGRFVLLEFTPNALDETDIIGWNSSNEPVSIDNALMGYDHAEIGYMACQHWKLPREICNFVRAHHMYDIAEIKKIPDSFKNLIIIIQLADYISVMMEKNEDWNTWSDAKLIKYIEKECMRSSWSSMNFSVPEIAEVLKKSKPEIDSMAVAVGIK